MVNGSISTEACGNLNLCDRLGSSIEGDVHVTTAKYRTARYPPATYKALLDVGTNGEKGLRGYGQGEEEGSCMYEGKEEVAGGGV